MKYTMLIISNSVLNMGFYNLTQIAY